jgi:cytoplasmic polyadenylation element-binding protein
VEIDDFADILSNKTDMGLDTPTGGIDSGDDTDSETTSLTKLIDKFQQKRSKRSGTPDKKSSIISRLGRNIGNDDNAEKGSAMEKKLSSSPSSSLLSKFGTRKSKTLDTGDEGGESTILTAFLKSRKKDTAVDKTPPPKKRSVEVEDGVEIFEDMTISAISEDTTAADAQPTELQLDLTPPTVSAKSVDTNKPVPAVKAPTSVSSVKNMVLDNQIRLSAAVLGLISIIFLEVPPFLLGFLTCLVLVFCGHKVYNWAVESCSPEIGQAQIVETVGSTVCELPPVIEHKSLKSYAGWMYETLNYDPNNLSLLRTAVFVKLDGSLLRISTASSRIKRSLLYKDAIDTSTVDFIQHKFYNLEDVKIEMSPKGLARKRYFSRKYPILLLVPRTNGEAKRWADSKQNSEDDSQSTPTKSSEERRFDRIYLFAIRDREKEDWFRRFTEASVRNNCDAEFPPEFLTLLGRKRSSPDPSVDLEPDAKGYLETEFPKVDDKGKEDEDHDFTMVEKAALNETADSFHIRASASRLPVDFLNFIGSYQVNRVSADFSLLLLFLFFLKIIILPSSV